MYKVKLFNNINPTALQKLDSSKYTVSPDEENPDAIILRSAKLHDMEFNPELLCIVRAGSGVNNIPIDRCADEGIVVFNTPGANAEAVKELAICAMLMSCRNVLGGVEWVRSIAAEGDNVPALVEKGKKGYAGPEILGKTLGVIGLGAIGSKIAQACNGLGMKVYGFDPYLTVEGAWQLTSDVIPATSLDELYRNSDYISLNVPHRQTTHHLINKESIEKMKPGVRIINLARAELVNDDDIIEALETGKVASYVTDFPNAKTAAAPGVIAIPHLGASTPESEDNSVSMACIEVMEYIENGNILHSVNMPHAYLPRSGFPRVCVIHDNVPEMIAKITAATSSFGVNIENMLNASTKDGRMPAYTILEVSSLPDGIAEKIRKINAVKRVHLVP